MHTALAVLLLAAGASRRMGGTDKLLLPVDGVAMLRRQARACLEAGLTVTVTVPGPAHPRVTALSGLAVTLAQVEGDDGMGGSLRAGLEILPKDASGVMIVLGDMPGLDASDFRRLARAHDNAPHAILHGETEDGIRGHPVVFPADLIPMLRGCKGDRGGQRVLAACQARVQGIPLPGQRAIQDIDTPRDWAAWLAAQTSAPSTRSDRA
ncbi:CTP:molybdopterin cytidylyltransferase MocA [Rhodovulum imhoffii]|uniref:CTP:molybdopterin cytidylyltransferase MocA n=1 Tax=Rhodovulum imhoffii TaxID=365340 RepID=A0A2T5BTM4_9RHOB|nr:nucleotidyltransferase family protein [Rhodovulum imhoffii]MBK5934139.1 hypothetical protein [Rhodovulum imhoffii]PTN02787.1 CTP:molybdopterin cytidylyltransferase MocA [Rhodovulum imhoffii]